MTTGQLTIVGLGIKMAAHLTVEARAWIEQSDTVFFLSNGPIADAWLQQLNERAINLASHYALGKRRLDTYQEMVAAILTAVRQNQHVCAVFYGHPGVFVWPSHAAIRQARQEGFQAQMLPGISAEDCLFADLGIDPARDGCQSYEATDFLVRPRRFDTSSGLVLWQIGVVGNLEAAELGRTAPGLQILVKVLSQHYGPMHEVFLYEAAQTPVDAPRIQHLSLQQLPQANVTDIATLYVPPQRQPSVDEDMMAQLGLTQAMLRLRA